MLRRTRPGTTAVTRPQYGGWIVGALALFAGAGGCVAPIDALGLETLVSEKEQLSKDANLEDDRIEDKHPVFDPGQTVIESFEGCAFEVNKSGAVTKLDIVPFAKDEKALDGVLFSDREAALAAAAVSGGVTVIPSMEVVNGAAKHDNDAVYAAVERVAQDGVGEGLRGKREVFTVLAAQLRRAWDGAEGARRDAIGAALVHLGGGLALGGTPLAETLPASLVPSAEAALAEFEAMPGESRPMGFYAGDEALERIFRQDRFLQNAGGDALYGQFGMFVAIAAALREAPALRSDYERLLAVYEGLTNPYAAYPPTALVPYVSGYEALDDLDAVRTAFLVEHPERFPCPDAYPYLAVLPASVSKDTRFYNAAYCYTGPPTDMTFIDALIAAIRDGAVDLTPDPESGWYDYQLHALETLLVPDRGLEKDHLLLTASYKKKLLDSFKSLITQTRETHAKQLAKGGMATAAPEQIVDLYPLLPVEPFPTYYLRTARAYRFVALWLDGVLGAEGMARPVRTGGATVAETLAGLEARFYGLYVLAAESVGLDPAAGLLEDELDTEALAAARSAAAAWVSGWKGDAQVVADSRVMVPVALDANTAEMIYWAVIGVKAVKMNASFVAGYAPTVTPLDYCTVGTFVARDYVLLVEEMVEVRLRADAAPPTREELRSLCDAHPGDRAAIVSALEAL